MSSFAQTGYFLQVVKYLLEKGAKLDVREDYNITPIFTAAHYGQLECLKLLLEEAKSRGKMRHFRQSRVSDESVAKYLYPVCTSTILVWSPAFPAPPQKVLSLPPPVSEKVGWISLPKRACLWLGLVWIPIVPANILPQIAAMRIADAEKRWCDQGFGVWVVNSVASRPSLFLKEKQPWWTRPLMTEEHRSTWLYRRDIQTVWSCCWNTEPMWTLWLRTLLHCLYMPLLSSDA